MAKAQISKENMDFMLEMIRKFGLDKKLEEEEKQKGRIEVKYNVAKNMLDILDDETIAMKVGLPVDEIKKLRNK